VLPALLGAVISTALGQSSEQTLPTPVLSNEINGRIAPLDLGDPRLTRHYYAFEGSPGDLLITIDSKNLNGDMDIFTAVTFRPLMKTTLYASSQSGEVTKGLYLRSRQIFVLRVEARTPNDETGTYHIRFGGTFAPFSGGIPVAENTAPQEDSTAASGNRLSSVGATIPRPVVETPATTEPKVAENEKSAEDKAATARTPAASAKPKPTRPAGRNSRPRPVRPKAAPAEPSKTEEAKKETTAPKEEKTESSAAEKPAAKSNTQELPLAGPHLIIESKDGTKIDRPMATVRRVVVEGGMIVIVLKTGRIERIPMASVNRMAIEP
jgi:hypothetical protein